MASFTVIVGNIGTVHVGNNFMVASKHYRDWVKLSQRPTSRAAGEPVTFMHGDNITREYSGLSGKAGLSATVSPPPGWAEAEADLAALRKT